MKYYAILLFALLQFNLTAQIKGNKNIITKTYPIENLQSIDLGLYAEVEVDCSLKEGLTITTDENLFDLIDKTVEDGRLVLVQNKWIQPSRAIVITIGTPNLEQIQQSVHQTTVVQNINRKSFVATALLGKLVLKGTTENLAANGETGEIDARKLTAQNVNINLWSDGEIQLGSPDKITGIVKADGLVAYNGKPTTVKVRTKDGGTIKNGEVAANTAKYDTKFIQFKLKNNSLNRVQLYVKGRKPNGNYFSYGFPMNPGQVRNKDWTIGSKVYRVSHIGTRKLLKEIKGDDEGELVKLYN